MKMIGIFDALGIESFTPFISKEESGQRMWMFEIRAKLNPQRNAINYCLDFTDGEIKVINRLITQKKYVVAGEFVSKKYDAINKTRTTEVNAKLYEVYKIRGYL